MSKSDRFALMALLFALFIFGYMVGATVTEYLMPCPYLDCSECWPPDGRLWEV